LEKEGKELGYDSLAAADMRRRLDQRIEILTMAPFSTGRPGNKSSKIK
jgi:hypothetical protein